MRVRLVCMALLWGCAGDKDGVETADSGVDCSDPDADHYDGVPVTVGLGVGPVCGTAVVSSVVTGVQEGARIGDTVAGADLNGDGLSDLLISTEPEEGNPDVYVMRSPLSETSTTDAALAVIRGFDTMEGGGGGVRALGDQDGDGFEDLIIVAYGEGIAAPVFYGPVEGEQSMLASDAWIAAERGVGQNGGDVDGDGTDDLLFSTYYDDTVVYSYLIGDTWNGESEIDAETPVIVDGFEDEDCAPRRGWDMTGDGLEEVVLECYSIGRVYVVNTPVMGTFSTADADARMSHEGRYLMGNGAGDTNGDGYADLLVGERHESPESDNPYGEVYLVPAPLSSELTSADAEASWYGFYVSEDHFAEDIVVEDSGADVNADGFSDYWLRSDCPPGTYRGCQTLVLSPAEGAQLVSYAAWGLASSSPDYSYLEVANVGDLNGDGVSDSAFGEPAYDTDTSVTEFSYEGGTWVLLGGVF